MAARKAGDTLKGGVLLASIVMILLLIAGGLVRLYLGPPARKPAYRVQVKLPDQSSPVVSDGTDASAGVVPLPAGAVDVEPPTVTGPELVSPTPAGLVRRECRHFVREASPSDTVTACANVFESAEAAFAAYSAQRPNPDTMLSGAVDRGVLVPGGFNLVKGHACYEIRRNSDSDGCRRLALDFLAALGRLNLGAPVTPMLTALRNQAIVPGTERLHLPRSFDPAIDMMAVSADFRSGDSTLITTLISLESPQAAATAADQFSSALISRGATRKTVPGTPDNTFVFLEGQLPTAIGSVGSHMFVVKGNAGVTAVLDIAGVFAEDQSLAVQ
ncbi:MAG TPA: hypothetical protein PLY68_03410 [Myxococcota bacterium]|nr:hypothetical protein [Myxococcota bacterium]HQP95229.1 hypothetical protein [Myxococcota bacterium]